MAPPAPAPTVLNDMNSGTSPHGQGQLINLVSERYTYLALCLKQSNSLIFLMLETP